MSKFVIFTPDHKDYFVSFVDARKGNDEMRATWDEAIEKALTFRTFEQAQKVAQVLADKMLVHPEPYAIQICEVKEKRGTRKVSVLCDVLPTPDRTAWHRDNPANVTRLDAPPDVPEIAPITFVLWREETDDYLASVELKGLIETTLWHPHPEEALRYATLEEARAKAEELVPSKGYALELCALHETEKKMWVEHLSRCAPHVPGQSSLN